MSEFSFFDDLTNVSSNDSLGFPATQLIKDLIQTIGHDLCTINRNCLSSYQLVHFASKIYGEINKLIGDSDVNEETEDSWREYDQYAKDIDPLECLLFEFALLVEKESKLSLSGEKESIPECIQFVDDWVEARKKIQDIFTGLQSLSCACSDDKAAASIMQRHDDSTLLSVFCTAIRTHSLEDNEATGRTNGSITALKSDANTLLSMASKEKITSDSICMSVKFTMLLHGMMQVSGKSSDEVKMHPKFTKMWDKAKNLLSALLAHLKDDPVKFDVLERKYESFIKYLKDLPVEEVPPEYLILRRAAMQVMRPYHSRTCELVSQCCALVTQYKINKNPTKFASLAAALTAAVAAVNAATAAMTVIEEHSEDIESSAAAAAFGTAQEKIKECFMACNMMNWVIHEKKMAEALEQDKDHVNKLNARFRRGNTSNPGTGSINLILKKSNGQDDVTYQTEETTTLHAILWKRAQNEPTLLQACYFEQDGASGERERIGYHRQVKDIRGTGSERTLYLVTM